jgi:hypothetical protein
VLEEGGGQQEAGVAARAAVRLLLQLTTGTVVRLSRDILTKEQVCETVRYNYRYSLDLHGTY